MTTKTKTNSPIGKEISKVPSRHKDYFELDSDNKIFGYKRSIGIDKVILKARLTEEEMQELEAQFDYHIEHESKANGYTIIRHIMDLIEPFGVYIKLLPYEKGVNAELQLHSKFTTNLIGNNPIILDILNNPKWFIIRLDVATDYVTPYNTSAYLRSHGNKKQENFETSSWSGSMGNSNKKACESHYDRKEEDETLESNFTNRFEVKLFFKEGDNMTFGNLNHSVIVHRLQKEMFIPCLTYSYFHDKDVKTTIGNKSYVELIKRAKGTDCENSIKPLLTKSQWKTFRKHFKASSDDIEQAYIENSHIMYDFLLPIEPIESRYADLEAFNVPMSAISDLQQVHMTTSI